MKINSYNDTIHYILCPSNTDTGGPKDLHQLALELKNLGKKVFMYYFSINKDVENKDDNEKKYVHKNLEVFEIPYIDKIEDSEKNILIIPEVYQAITISKKFKNIQKILWWLSLDFYFITYFNDHHSRLFKSVIKFPHEIICFFNKLTKNYFGNMSFPKYLKLIYLNFPLKNMLKLENIKINLSQSKYQYNILNSKNIKSILLCDYIRDEYFQAAKKVSNRNKENIACFNPSKSSNFMNRIIESNPNVKFIPLSNYKMTEIIEILSLSKIYIDFGFHPGVDHLPREAAILKNCIITNKEGSAFYSDAVGINDKYKFEEKNKNLVKISETIKNIFLNFDKELKNFDEYVKKIEEEKSEFNKQVISIFN